MPSTSRVTAPTLFKDPAVVQLARRIRNDDEATLAVQTELTEIPAPPFGEAARGARVGELLADAGLRDVRTDAVGNVMGMLSGERAGPPLVVSAHLDTVFPAGTPVRVRREGDRLHAPGISDDGRGLAALVTLARVLAGSGRPPGRDLLFVATVGEEGVGDLRGARHLVGPDGAARGAAGFVSLDGAGLRRVVTRGLGSRRVRLEVRGPGGHSWADRGTANPIHVLAETVHGLTSAPGPRDPEAGSVTVARWGGGGSINAIPVEAWVEVDLRATRPGDLDELSDLMSSALDEAIEAANGARLAGTDPLSVEVVPLGERPAGRTPTDAPLVQAAIAATRALGVGARLVTASTDANAAMSVGIPAVTVGAGGAAGQTHTLHEWYDNRGGADGIVRAMWLLLMAAEG